MKNNTISIENRSDVIRDGHSKAILNTDIESLKAWKKRKEKIIQIERHENDINNIKSDINEIKSMIQELIKVVK